MKCKKCGTENPPNINFCRTCGKQLSKSTDIPLVVSIISLCITIACFLYVNIIRLTYIETDIRDVEYMKWELDSLHMHHTEDSYFDNSEAVFTSEEEEAACVEEPAWEEEAAK